MATDVDLAAVIARVREVMSERVEARVTRRNVSRFYRDRDIEVLCTAASATADLRAQLRAAETEAELRAGETAELRARLGEVEGERDGMRKILREAGFAGFGEGVESVVRYALNQLEEARAELEKGRSERERCLLAERDRLRVALSTARQSMLNCRDNGFSRHTAVLVALESPKEERQ